MNECEFKEECEEARGHSDCIYERVRFPLGDCPFRKFAIFVVNRFRNGLSNAVGEGIERGEDVFHIIYNYKRKALKMEEE